MCSQQQLTDLLDEAAQSGAGLIIYPMEGSEPRNLTYSELRRLALHQSQLLLSCGLTKSGEILLLYFDSQLDRIIWFWTVVLAGCVPCVLPALANSRDGHAFQFRHLCNLLLDPLVITSNILRSTIFADSHLFRVASVEDIEATGPAPVDCRGPCPKLRPAGATPHAATDGIAALLLTSGSTGSSKAVCLTYDQILSAMRGKLAAMPLSPGTSLLNWIALDHVASLVEIHLCAMLTGLNQVHIPATKVVADPLFFLHLITREGVSRTFAPNFLLHKLLTALDAASPDQLRDISLRSLEYIASGGEANNVKVCARLTEHLLRLGAIGPDIIRPGFGMTETCAGAIFSSVCSTADIHTDNEFAAVGTCMPGIEMRISPLKTAEADCSMLDNGGPQHGALELRGPVVFRRYFNDPLATQEAFTPDGWFKTGDLGLIDESGNLRLAGRSKDVININGVKYLPHEIETEIEQASIPGVAPSFVVCFAGRTVGSSTEEITIVYQHTYDVWDADARVQTLGSMASTVMKFTGSRPRILPVAPGLLERTSLGKLSRAKVRSAVEQGHFQEQADIDAQAIKAYRVSQSTEPLGGTERVLARLLVERLNISEIDVDTCFLATGMTSIDLIQLKTVLQREFEITDLPLSTVITHTTIRSLSSAIQEASPELMYNPVITLQPIGSEQPLWLIHPGIGEVLVFLGISQYFENRPIHAMRARGFNKGEEPFQDLTDVLTTYYAALRNVQPHGPYAMAGYSYGSMIAFELAKMLETDGERVAFLGSFNLPPHIKTRMRTLDWTAGVLHISHFCGIITEEQSDGFADELRSLPRTQQVARVLAASDQERCAKLALTPESLETWTNVAWSLQKIGWEYEPSGNVAQMDVFYCQPLKVVSRTRQDYRDRLLSRWVDFSRSEVRYHEVGGEHYTMLGPEQVVGFQQVLDAAMKARGV
ncbi:putative polyketide synthase PksJ [Aspergillus keveii]|uniref:Polyketide synthase PksJ n=1 Tax=Aspergillus keveii TaxID=714993 RepID=A0ABR4G8U8_9EURO